MPLPQGEDRELLHNRSVLTKGFKRKDGLWDIEGHLVDTKTYGFDNEDHSRRFEAGDPIHEMWLRITIDTEFLVHDVVAVTDHSPFQMCPDIVGNFKQLKGLRIGPGWMREVRSRVGGVQGCTHLLEMLGAIGTTAYQTLYATREEHYNEQGDREAPDILNTCHALSSESEVVQRIWPKFYNKANS